MLTDPVLEYRQKAAKEAAEAAARAAQEAAEREGRPVPGAPGPGASEDRPAPDSEGASPQKTPEMSATPDSERGLPAKSPENDGMVTPADSSASDGGPNPQAGLSPSSSPAEGLPPAAAAPAAAAPADTPATPADSLKAPADTLRAPADSLIAPQDSTKIGFLDAKGNIRIFRQDIQIRCDSLRYNDLDSIARLYIDPIVWNDGNRQYTADSLFALVVGNAVDRVALESEAFIITQESQVLFDQIKATEIMAYFDSTAALRRFDGLGGTTAVFFIKEKERIGTVNKVDTKMMSALFRNGELDRIFYFDSPKNDVYPLAQLRKADRELKGFNWRPELRPTGPEDITALKVRPSERAAYEKHPRTVFKQTDIYFPGYMKSVYKAIDDSKRRKAESGRTGPEPPAGPKISKAEPDSAEVLPPKDTVSVEPVLSDSLAVKDTTAVPDTLAAPDSLLAAEAQRPPTRAELRAKRRAEAERRRAERLAARDARWAELDARDAAKAAEKAAKKQAREKEKLARQLERQRRQDLDDEAKLNKYIERYRKRKAREDARTARKAEKAHKKAALRAAKLTRKDASDTLAAPDTVATPAPPVKLEQINQKDNNGTDPEQISPLRGGGYPEQRGVRKPTIDKEAVKPSEAAVQGAE